MSTSRNGLNARFYCQTENEHWMWVWGQSRPTVQLNGYNKSFLSAPKPDSKIRSQEICMSFRPHLSRSVPNKYYFSHLFVVIIVFYCYLCWKIFSNFVFTTRIQSKIVFKTFFFCFKSFFLFKTTVLVEILVFCVIFQRIL